LSSSERYRAKAIAISANAPYFLVHDPAKPSRGFDLNGESLKRSLIIDVGDDVDPMIPAREGNLESGAV
jgi:hypothetical protein